ncbi:MAG: hypothetical protein VX676_05640 [Pseudomonadota bacterium]|nr:hypothetical protein [Pseudomonadota bacterium]
MNKIAAFVATLDRFLPLLGGSMAPVVWDVIGSELTLREHVTKQAGLSRVTVLEACERLIIGLDIFARPWLYYVDRSSDI